MPVKTPSINQLKAQLAKLERDRNSPTSSSNTDQQIVRIKVAIQFHTAFVNACQGIEITQPSVEWYTPAWLVALARDVLGVIDVDPASNARANKTVRAKLYYTEEQDGLTMPWHGQIFCNPPYGDACVLFLNHALDLYFKGKFHSGIFIVNRSGARRYRDARNQFSVLCELHKRVAFINAQDEEETSPRYSNDVLYLGPQTDKFIEHFEPYGDCRILN